MVRKIHVTKICTANLTDLDKWVMPLLRLFVSKKTCPELAQLLIDYSIPNPDAQGRDYSEAVYLLDYLLNQGFKKIFTLKGGEIHVAYRS